jgi:hypothetical protein
MSQERSGTAKTVKKNHVPSLTGNPGAPGWRSRISSGLSTSREAEEGGTGQAQDVNMKSILLTKAAKRMHTCTVRCSALGLWWFGHVQTRGCVLRLLQLFNE